MKLLTSLNDVPELKKQNVHIRDEAELLKKLNKMIKDGHSNLQIVTDFDHTLTRHTLDNGSTVLTSFGKLILFFYIGLVPQSEIYEISVCDIVLHKIKYSREFYQ